MQLEYFQLIDRIESIDLEAGRIVVRATVPTRSTVFEGHFPGHPLMPGVLLLEAMAQTAGQLVLCLHRFTRMPFLAGADKLKLRRFVEPGEELELIGELVHDGSGYAMMKGAGRSGGVRVCEADIKFVVQRFPNAQVAAEVRARSQSLGVPAELLAATVDA